MGRHFAVIATSSTLIFFAFRLSQAGSLTPPADPSAGGTLRTAEEVYDSLASGSFDSSAVTASESGSLIGVSKCIIQQMTGGSCP